MAISILECIFLWLRVIGSVTFNNILSGSQFYCWKKRRKPPSSHWQALSHKCCMEYTWPWDAQVVVSKFKKTTTWSLLWGPTMNRKLKQQFHQYKQQEQSSLTFTHWTEEDHPAQSTSVDTMYIITPYIRMLDSD